MERIELNEGSYAFVLAQLAMTLQAAADHLLAVVNLPPGSVNILPIPSEDGGRLVVWIDSRYFLRARDLPSSFEGYEVSIESRPEITPHGFSALSC